MKSPGCLVALSAFLAVAALAAVPARAELLAGWDTWADTSSSYNPDHLLTGFSASITQSTATDRVNSSFGSNDGSFGTVAGASTAGRALLLRTLSNQNLISLTLTNNTAQPYFLDSLSFDFAPRSPANGGPNHLLLKYTTGDLAPNNTTLFDQTLSYVIIDTPDSISNYPDYDFNLAAYLSDITLGVGQSATFTLLATYVGSNPNPDGYTSSVIDNVAFIGAPVPEPATLALLGAAGLLIGRPRRRA